MRLIILMILVCCFQSCGKERELHVHEKEYEWLQENLRKHHFSESFPEGNDKGVGYEPWHWRYGVEDSSTA